MREASPIGNRCATCCQRRVFLKQTPTGVAGLALLELLGLKSVAAAASASREPKLVKIIEFSDSGERGQKLPVPMITGRMAETTFSGCVRSHAPGGHRATLYRRISECSRQGYLPMHLLRYRFVQFRD